MNQRSMGSLASVVVLFVAAMVVAFSLPAGAATTITAPKVHSGVDAGDMVRDLLATSPHLRAAIATHERQGQPLFLDAATVIEAQAIPDSVALVLPSSLADASSTFYADNVQLIFIPDAYSTGYWDGTVDARQYDSAGNLVAEYLADVTGGAPDATTPLTVTYQHVLYDFDRRGIIKLDVAPAPEIPDLPGGAPSTDQGPQQTGPQPQISSLEWLGGWGSWAKCTGAWCVGAAGGCGLANLINAEIGWLPCTAGGCVTGAIGCTYGTLWK